MPRDLKGRAIPARYLAGLPVALQRQRAHELTASRDAYRQGRFAELPTDREARRRGLVRTSAYTLAAKRRGVDWRGDAAEMAHRILYRYGGRSADVGAVAALLRTVFDRGLAAWQSGGHRPGASAQAWAIARVNSFAVGGKTAWTADRREFAQLPHGVRVRIVRAIRPVLRALKTQGRDDEATFILQHREVTP